MAGKLKPLDVERETKPLASTPTAALYHRCGANLKELELPLLEGRQGTLAWLGSFKDVSLKKARLARDAARQRRRNIPGVDIVQEKRAAREETKAAEIEAKAPTFEQCAEAYITAHSSTWARNIVTNGPRP